MELREAAGKHDDAERLATQAADAGDIDGLEILAAIRQAPAGTLSPGRDPRRMPQPFVVGVIPAAAERIHRLAAAAGSVRAQRIIAVLEERAGNHADAERLALQAAEAGNYGALKELILLREKREEDPDAERLAVLAAGVGDTAPLLRLMKRREQEGKHANAERLADQAAEAGWPNGLLELAELREKRGEHTEAERLAAKAARAGNTSALVKLAQAREQAGKYAQAERLAAAAGTSAAPLISEMAKQRKLAGKHAEAERLAVEAAAGGSPWAVPDLVEALEHDGKHIEADRLAIRTIDVSSFTEGLNRLTTLREQVRDYSGAERLYHIAIDTGLEYLPSLARLLKMSGDGVGAEQLLRFGLDANGVIASAWCIQDINT